MKHGSGGLDIGRSPEPACRVARLWLSVMADSLSNLCRQLALPRSTSLTFLVRQKTDECDQCELSKLLDCMRPKSAAVGLTLCRRNRSVISQLSSWKIRTICEGQ